MEPFTWWIHTVAAGCQGLPVSTVSASPLVVLLAYGWIVAGLLLGHPIKTLGIVVGILTAASCAGAQHRAPVVPLDSIAVHVVETEEEVGSAPPGTQAIIVRSGEGRPRDRPSRTKEGIPVLYPARDGPVSLHADGTQHAADGRF